MKRSFTFIFSAIFLLSLMTGGMSYAQISPCSACDGLNPNFTVRLVPYITGTNASGKTTAARFDVFVDNNMNSSLDLTTIELSLGINSGAMNSLTGISSDATNFPNSNIVNPASGDFVSILDEFNSETRTFNGLTYDKHYEYDHTGTGPSAPPQTITPGTSDQIMSIYLNFNGTQAFSADLTAPNSIFSPSLIAGFPGECVFPEPNINNQWGFVNSNGNQLLINCYNVVFAAAPSPLPLDLSEFVGEVRDRFNRLSWVTFTETNTKWHVVERSLNPASDPFREIGRLEAAGTSTSPLSYELNDEMPPLLGYYRLRTEDTNGEYFYSNIVVLKRDESIGSVNVYPNPTTGPFEVQIALAATSDLRFEIVDALGRVLQSRDLKGQEDLITLEFDLSEYADGLYMIKIKNDAGRVLTQSVFKGRP